MEEKRKWKIPTNKILALAFELDAKCPFFSYCSLFFAYKSITINQQVSFILIASIHLNCIHHRTKDDPKTLKENKRNRIFFRASIYNTFHLNVWYVLVALGMILISISRTILNKIFVLNYEQSHLWFTQNVKTHCNRTNKKK